MSLSIATAMLMARRESLNADLTLTEWESLRSQFIESRALYGTVFLDTVVGQTLFLRGELALAQQALRQGHASAVRLHSEGSSFAAMPGCQLAAVLYELDELDAARDMIERFEAVTPAFGLADSVIARATVASRLAMNGGRYAVAHRALDAAAHVASEHGLSRLHPYVAYERLRLHLAEGNFQDAGRLMEDPRYRDGYLHTAPGRQPNSTKLAYALGAARFAIERGDFTAGITLLRAWLGVVKDRNCIQHAIALLVMLAKALYRSNERLAAQRSLIDALRLGASGEFIRSFLDGGSEIAALLRELHDSRPGPELCSVDYLGRLFTACGIQATVDRLPVVPRAMEPEEAASLTAKEIDVLRLTAKHLVAREVAQHMGVAETTVKWYWRRIFSKLGVHRRAAAVRIAQQRGLLR
jgi:LuxR family maltose regulon positive regulatory protein